LDVIPDLSAGTEDQVAVLFQPGNLSLVGPVTFSTGGAVSNTGLALHRLGIRTRLMGKVGDDQFGQAIRQIVEAHGPGLTSGMVADATTASSYTVIISPPGVDRIFLHHPGANDVFSADDVRYDVVAGARLFHFGYPPLMKRMYEDGGAQLTEIFRRVKGMGVTTSLDMAIPDVSSEAGRVDWAAILGSVMEYVDIFLPSIEESLLMLRRETYEALWDQAGGPAFLGLVTAELLSDLGRQLLEMGAKIVGFKLGHRGFYVRTAGSAAIADLGAARPPDPDDWADKELWAPVFEVDVVGTTGAGDATIAGFLSALLRGMSLEDAVTAAVAVGASNVEAADALGGVRSWEDTWRRVRAGWPRRNLDLGAPGWRHDAVTGHWVGPAV
jgi:sugar/nucleoside kinase (ribokinase family)